MGKNKKTKATEGSYTLPLERVNLDDLRKKGVIVTEVNKEISPPNTTLAEMRQIVGYDGVTGRHTGGSNEARTTEDQAMYKINKH